MVGWIIVGMAVLGVAFAANVLGAVLRRIPEAAESQDSESSVQRALRVFMEECITVLPNEVGGVRYVIAYDPHKWGDVVVLRIGEDNSAELAKESYVA